MAYVRYENEMVVEDADLSQPLLQISLAHGIPHTHACGGNARCSTCRVMLLEGAQNALPRNEAEARLAKRKGLEDNIRLACQTRFTGSVCVRRLVLDDEDAEVALAESGRSTGKEVPLAILFGDIRSFTPFAERALPYDVIHILNRYFHSVGEAILDHGGYIDKYMGDGIMALFGLEGESPAATCQNAVLAALEMLEAVGALNQHLKRHFQTHFEVGIGIHYGEVIVGEIGHPRHMQFSAIGDAANMASRIESANKTLGTHLLISGAVFDRVGSRLRAVEHANTELKGKSGDYSLYEVAGMALAWEHADGQESLEQRLRKALRRRVTRPQAPAVLRLAFHDAFNFDPRTGRGGADGSIRFEAELARPQNQGLEPAVQLLADVKEYLPEVSWGDIIATAGAVAVERCHGPHIPLALGRPEADGPSSSSSVPDELWDTATMKHGFSLLGLSVRDMVALCGAHTLGRARGKPFTDDLFTFSNSYFKRLLDPEDPPQLMLLASDRLLASDAECRAVVESFARDEGAWYVAFTAAYQRLTALGGGAAAGGVAG